MVIVGGVTIASGGIATLAGISATPVMMGSLIGGGMYVGGMAVTDLVNRQVSGMDKYVKAALAGAAQLVPMGNGMLGRMGMDALTGMSESALSQLIMEGKIDPERVLQEGLMAVIMGMVIRGLWGGSGSKGNGKDIGYMKNNADPMRDALGSGRISNPDEWESIIKQLEDSGVEMKFREGDMAYAPGLSDGNPGQIVIDPDASLSALKHEYQHFMDVQAEEFPSFGKQMIENPKSRVIKELRAYMVEIKEADRLGLKGISEQLFENYRQERGGIVNQYILPGGE